MIDVRKLFAGALLALVTLLWPLTLQAQSNARVVINEIHYNPHLPREHVEFVELYNRSNTAVNISGWRLDGAVGFIFPDGTMLPPYHYAVVAQSPGQLQAKFGVENTFGPYSGKLNNDGEEVILRSDLGPRVDVVDYAASFPWPIVGVNPGYSIQLQHPKLDNRHAGSWRAAMPTPGRRNAVYTTNSPPLIASVSHTPQAPTSDDAVTISVDLADRDGIAAVTLSYQVVAPGEYIPRNAPAYADGWTSLDMRQGEDGLYHATLPADLQHHRHLVRYRVTARDAEGQSVLVPYPEDPQANFAYFVYDGVPPWRGSVDGGQAGAVDYDFGQMATLPVYHLIARQEDVADAQFLPDSDMPSGYAGNDYLWYGTLVYDGVVYDHIGFRARGGLTRYATGKNMWKFNFYRGHRFEAHDDYGRPYNVAWDKLNLSAVIQQTHRGYRGEQGMFESMSFRLFNLAGVEAPLTHFVHFRVIDDAFETGGSQYDGDFWGLYLAIEQMDGRFLEQHGLPNGNLYKMEVGATERNNHSPAGVGEWPDLRYFTDTLGGSPSVEWLRRHVDLARYYAYRAIIEAVHHYDVDQGKNYFYYHNPETDRWVVHPWDVDLTWAAEFAGSGEEPFRRPVLTKPPLNLEYQNTLRTLRDLLFNTEQMDWMLREHAGFIDTADNGRTMVDADRALWDYNPVYATRYVNPERTAPGQFYVAVPSRDFPGMVERMRGWVRSRSQWIDATLLTDRNHPARPQVRYTGSAGFPADDLRFATTPFVDPQGAGTFGALQWRIAEVTDPAAPAYSPTAPILYEMNAVYESPVITEFAADFTPPPGTVRTGHSYRVRVRMQDNSGRWSHWSPPLAFVAGPAQGGVNDDLRISEIMYHPAPLGEVNDKQLEFIELTNTGEESIYIGRAALSGAIEYTFVDGLTLEPGEYIVLASDRDGFFDRYRFRPFDEFDRQLNNGGETLTLTDTYGRLLAEIAYDDQAPWPTAADGNGPSLVFNQLAGDAANPDNWRASFADGGSPGAADPLSVVINEIQLRTEQNAYPSIELYNPTDLSADISHWRLNGGPNPGEPLRFPSGTVIPPRSYRVFSAGDFDAQDATLLQLPRTGGQLRLESVAQSGHATGYITTAIFQGFDNGDSYGRHVTSDGRVFFVPQAEPSLGRANPAPPTRDLVISEIMYYPDDGQEFVAITNVSNQPVMLYDAAQPHRNWRLDGALFTFPYGLELPAGGTVLVVADDPAQVCIEHALPPYTQVTGPLSRSLIDDGEQLTLMRPLTPTGSGATPYMPEDVVAYDDATPWPPAAAGQGALLERSVPEAFGSEPAHWRARHADEGLLRAGDAKSDMQLCAFVASYREDEDLVVIDWSSAAETDVDRYNLWRNRRNDPDSAELLTPDGIPAVGNGEPARYTFTDPLDHASAADWLYRLEAVSAAGDRIDLAMTEPNIPYRHVYLPFFGR